MCMGQARQGESAGEFAAICQAGQGLCYSGRFEPGGDLEQGAMGAVLRTVRGIVQRDCRKIG
ncbi:hypothetical protein D3C81_1847240 [compost metagenome]